MNEIPDDAQQLLAYLVDQIHAGRFAVGNYASYVSYSEVLREMRLDPGIRKTPGQALQEQGMEALAVWARANGHPAITGLIVVRENNRPSDGYWTVNGLPCVDEPWWDDQIRQAFNYDWNQYLTLDQANLPIDFGERI